LLSAVPSVDGHEANRIRLPLEPRRSIATGGCVFAGRCPRRIGEICDSKPPPQVTRSATHSISCHLGTLTADQRLSK
jgi:peptide/nickel transport system ATP-binding protein